VIFDSAKVDPSAYKTKSLRSRTYEEKRRELYKGLVPPPEGKPRPRGVDLGTLGAHQLIPCPECGAHITAESGHCIYCGVKFPDGLAAAIALAAMARRKARKPPPPKLDLAPPKPVYRPTISPLAKTELGLNMLPVDGGEYADPNAGGQRFRLKSFYLSAAPITCAQYRVFLHETGHPAPRDWFEGYPLPGKDNHPVILVSLRDAMAFCRWAGVRLPTPQEWLAACAGKNGRAYPWGADGDGIGRQPGKPPRRTTYPVDAFARERRGPFGHDDLLGNVVQWVFKSDLSGRDTGDPAWSKGVFGLAGASYLDPVSLGANGRFAIAADPALADYVIGFRCASDTPY
jgi:hypothetical protein